MPLWPRFIYQNTLSQMCLSVILKLLSDERPPLQAPSSGLASAAVHSEASRSVLRCTCVNCVHESFLWRSIVPLTTGHLAVTPSSN